MKGTSSVLREPGRKGRRAGVSKKATAGHFANELWLTGDNEAEITWQHLITIKIAGQDIRQALLDYIKHHGYLWENMDNILHTAEWFRIRKYTVAVQPYEKLSRTVWLITKMFIHVWKKWGRHIEARTKGMDC